jgi:phosphoglycerol transferase
MPAKVPGPFMTRDPAHQDCAASPGGGRRIGAEAAWIVLGLLLTAAALRVFAGPAAFDLGTPLVYQAGDGLSHAMIVKSILDTGWFPGRNEYLGAPFGAAQFDYPQSESLNYLLIRGFALFWSDWVEVANAFALLGFFLASTTAFLVLRGIGLLRPWALLGGLLFSFLPYHSLQIEPLGHLLLAACFGVPLAVWMALRVWSDAEPRAGTRWWLPARPLWSFGAAVVVGASGVYYAFFACVLVLVSGTATAVARRSSRPLVSALLLVLATASTVGLNVAPSLQYRWTHGPNTETAVRHPAESEVFGLKVVQMLLPQPDHRWAPARALATRYASSTPLLNENQASAIGLLGSVGFLTLMGVAFLRLAGARGELTLLDKLAMLVTAAVLLGTIGGLGSLFAWTISPVIRAYNRISVFIGFMSLAAVLFVIQRSAQRLRAEGGGKRGRAALAAVALGLFGLWDQTAPLGRGDAAATFASDREFVQGAERRLPPGTMVYQMPYHPFPESGPLYRMEDYGHLRGYLHSRSLRWSYGGMRGREGDAWFRALGARSVSEQLATAVARGFGAVYIDRRAYPDRGQAIEAELVARMGEPVAVSGDGDRLIYRLVPFRQGVVAATPAVPCLSEGIDFTRRELPAHVSSTDGLAQAEPWGRWTEGGVATIRLVNPLPEKFTLELVARTAYGPNAGLPFRARIADQERAFVVSRESEVIRLEFDLRRPANTIEIWVPQPTSPSSLGRSADARRLGLGLESLRVIACP